MIDLINNNVWIESSVFCSFLVAFVVGSVIAITKNRLLDLVFYMVLYLFIDFALVIVYMEKELLVTPYIIDYNIIYGLVVLLVIILLRRRKRCIFSKK